MAVYPKFNSQMSLLCHLGLSMCARLVGSSGINKPCYGVSWPSSSIFTIFSSTFWFSGTPLSSPLDRKLGFEFPCSTSYFCTDTSIQGQVVVGQREKGRSYLATTGPQSSAADGPAATRGELPGVGFKRIEKNIKKKWDFLYFL